MLRRPNHQILSRFGVVLQKLCHTDSALVQSQPRLKDLLKDDRIRRKRAFNKYFVENLFINRFEETVLEYPQINSLKEVEDLDKQCRFARKYLMKAKEDEKVVTAGESDKVISTVKQLELTGFKLPLSNQGYGYLNSEYAYMLETLSLDPALATTVSMNEDFGADLIKAYGNTQQKDNYLTKIGQGECVVCFAGLEPEMLVSTEPCSLKTSAVLTPDGQNYIVNGTKSWVYNSKYADLMIFSANVTTTTLNSENKTGPTLFLVEKNLRGVKFHEPVKKVGPSGVDICEVTFTDAVIPSFCVLGEIGGGSDIVNKILINQKISNSAQIITISKKLINMAASHCIYNKHFKKNKYQTPFYQCKIAELVKRLYSLESMTYLVTGRLDSFNGADVFLETLILKVYGSEILQYILQETFSILGPEVFSSNTELEDLIKEAQYYLCSQDRNGRLRVILSRAGCEHALEYKKEVGSWKKISDRLTKQNYMYFLNHKYPAYVLIKEKLNGYLHLKLEEESFKLEDAVFGLKKATDLLIEKYGEGVVNRPVELILLADIVIPIYAMTAVLGRASRAFCICVENFEVDLSIAVSETKRLHGRVHESINLLKRHFKNFPDSQPISKEVDCGRSGRHRIMENLLIRNEQLVN